MVRKIARKKLAKIKVTKKKTVKRTVKRKPVKIVIKRKPTRKTSKKKPVKKAAKKTVVIKKVATKIDKKLIGTITHFFGNLSVAVIDLKGSLKVGDKIIIEGATTSFEQKVSSMQIDRKDIKEAKKGQDIGMKVKGKVRPGDKVYTIVKG